MPDFKITDRRLSTLYPPPPVTLPRLPRTPFCCEVLKNPDAHDSRACYQYAGHDGKHEWETCPAEHDCDGVGGFPCERDKGHPPPHRVVIEW